MKKHIFNFIHITLLIAFIIFLLPKANAQQECLYEPGIKDFEVDNGVGCDDWYNYAPYPNMDIYPIKTIRVAFHIIQDENGNGNLSNVYEHISFLNEIIELNNSKLSNLSQLNLNVTSPFILDSRIRMFLDGIHFHQIADLWDFSTNAFDKADDIYDDHIIANPAFNDIQKHHTLHLIVGGNYDVIGGWTYLGFKGYIGLRGFDYAYFDHPYAPYPQGCQYTLTHEFGHSCGLKHNFHDGPHNYQCDDCDDNDPPGLDCPVEATSNNIMDYWPGGGGGFSQCQIGKMHYFLSGNAGTIGEDVILNCDENITTTIPSGTDIVWYFDNKIPGDIVIEPAASLTIKCTIEMVTNSKIIVKQAQYLGGGQWIPAGKLIVDEGTITSACDAFWTGIEVWGISNLHQYEYYIGNRYQGMVTLKNNATIENAYDAIMLWKPGDWHSMGGIIQATDAFFYNNRRSVGFMSYQNFHPILGDEYPLANRSYFMDCHFEVNDDYINESDFNAHISMWDVNGISIRSSNFINEMTNGIHTGHGIYTASAGYSLLSKCNSQMSPCPEPYIVPCIFEGFYAGIEASNSFGTNYTIYVKEAEFNNNTYGVQLSTVNNAAIINSDFEIGYNDQDECEGEGEKSSGYGIYLDHCSGFAIEENEFTKYPGATGNYTGIFVSSTKATDEIYKNTFEELSYGNYASGQNWKSGYIYEGLTFFCNENQSNYADFYVEQDVVNPSGIQSKQGDDELVTGNKFSPSGAVWHFYNGGDHLVGYYYCDYCANENPDDDKIYNVTDKGKSFDNSCPSHYGGGSGRELVLSPEQKQEAEQEYAASFADYNNLKALYDNLKDGGNTEATISDVETSWPQDMWEVRTELLGKSPHLSMDVLKKAADKTDVLPESVLFEILAANPDELKKEELIKYLEDKENPLPEYMIDILRQVAGGTTYKTVLEQQMGRYNQAKTRAANDIIRSNLNDSITDYNELRNWLDNLGGVRADEQIIASYIQEDNFEDALTLANMMPDLYGYEANELIDHGYYVDLLNLQTALSNEGRNIFELNTTEINNLVHIAENSYGIAAAQAKGILEFAYGYVYCNCLKSSDNLSFKSSGNVNYDALNQFSGAEIIVSPNPAVQWTAFNYTLPDNETEGIIKISDVSGKLIEKFVIKGQQGQKVWDTRKINQGVYFYTFIVNGISKSGKIVIGK